jgi:cysteinyl-tRNA synthetase
VIEAENKPSDYKYEMRLFVRQIAEYARRFDKNFAIVPQNGVPIITTDGELDSPLDMPYINAINGTGQEDLFFSDNQETDKDSQKEVAAFLSKVRAAGKLVMVTDYTNNSNQMSYSRSSNKALGFISIAVANRKMSSAPPGLPFNENTANILRLTDAKNFLYLINPSVPKTDFITQMRQNNYDILLMEPNYGPKATDFYTKSETDQLKVKQNGGKRFLLCYVSIGEAEVYRYYYDKKMNYCTGYLDRENPQVVFKSLLCTT